MNNISFQINQKLEIMCEDGAIAKSVIQEIEEHCIYIGVPMNGGMYYPLNKGDIIEAYYKDNRGNVYKFNTVVTGRKFDKIPLLMIEMPSEVYKVQRRTFVRIDHLFDISYAPIKEVIENPTKKVLKEDFIKGYALDISGGGMRIKISTEVKLGDYLMVSVPIGDEIFLAVSKVVRVERDLENKFLICGIAFKELNNNTREKIIEYIFKNMRKTIRSK
ncbi:flagellar brake domain-containing protein [Clostridium sp.]|uniref:flagellar brake protein n=1 Tax=Clostridium sp. TaxID=1506 RepID=UPI002FCB3091